MLPVGGPLVATVTRREGDDQGGKAGSCFQEASVGLRVGSCEHGIIRKPCRTNPVSFPIVSYSVFGASSPFMILNDCLSSSVPNKLFTLAWYHPLSETQVVE